MKIVHVRTSQHRDHITTWYILRGLNLALHLQKQSDVIIYI